MAPDDMSLRGVAERLAARDDDVAAETVIEAADLMDNIRAWCGLRPDVPLTAGVFDGMRQADYVRGFKDGQASVQANPGQGDDEHGE
jgi:hypothetical protein